MKTFNILLFFLFCWIYPHQLQAFDDATQKHLDSIGAILKKVPSKDTRSPSPELQRQIDKFIRQNEQTIDYADAYKIVCAITQTKAYSSHRLNSFIKEYIPQPESTRKVNLYYIKLKWLEINELLETNRIDKANEVQKKLIEYLKTISIRNDDFKRAEIYATSYDIFLLNIQRNHKKGISLCKKIEASARQLKDTSLIIMAKYYRCEFYVYQRKLIEFIDVSEECFRLDSVRSEKSELYASNLMHLVDAYVYAGNNLKRSLYFLNLLYENPDWRNESYSYYAKLLAAIDPSDPIQDSIFGVVGAKDMLDYFIKTYQLCKPSLYPMSYYHFLRESAHALANFGYTIEAISAMEEANIIIKGVYTSDLTETLATHEKNMLEARKDLEIKHKEKVSRLYLILLVCIIAFVIVLVILLARKFQHNKILERHNALILERNKEKELLLRELNHRVKNNFQIISSLLSIQSKTIEDKSLKSILQESRSRISSMALTHEKLYRMSDFSYDLADYISSLHEYLCDIFGMESTELEINCEKPLKIDIEMAIPLGLILNELITNSFKYGADGTQKVRISIDARSNNSSLKLVYKDSGKGLASDIDLSSVQTMGLRLVTRLTKQLKGSVHYANGAFIFELPYQPSVLGPL